MCPWAAECHCLPNSSVTLWPHDVLQPQASRSTLGTSSCSTLTHRWLWQWLVRSCLVFPKWSPDPARTPGTPFFFWPFIMKNLKHIQKSRTELRILITGFNNYQLMKNLVLCIASSSFLWSRSQISQLPLQIFQSAFLKDMGPFKNIITKQLPLATKRKILIKYSVFKDLCLKKLAFYTIFWIRIQMRSTHSSSYSSPRKYYLHESS